MLNFDNSTARERLARNYTGVVDFGMGDFDSDSYLYSPKDYTIGGDTDYGALKIYDSDKFTIKTPQFKSAYHMAEFVSSPLPEVPSTTENLFSGADMNKVLSVPKDDLVLENYVGQELQAEGLKSEEEFFVSQARKEVFQNDPLTVFMNRPDVEGLITYTGGAFTTVSSPVNETQRKSRHNDARGVKVPAPAKKTISSLEVKPAFEEREDYKAAKKQLEDFKGETVLDGTVFQPKLTRKEKNDLKQRVLQLENQQKKKVKESLIANESFSVKRGNEVRHGRQYKKTIAGIQDQQQHRGIQAYEDIKVKEREEETKKKAYDDATAKKLADLQENHKKQSILKEKIQKVKDDRLAKKNNITSEEAVKLRKEEEKQQGEEEKQQGEEEKKKEEEEKKKEEENNDSLKLGGDFHWKEKKTLYDFFKNHNISLSEPLNNVKEKLKQYLKRNGLDFDGRQYKTTTKWFKRFLTAIDITAPPDLENQITPSKYPYGKAGGKILNENRVKTQNMSPQKRDRSASQPDFPYLNVMPLNLHTPLKSVSQKK